MTDNVNFAMYALKTAAAALAAGCAQAYPTPKQVFEIKLLSWEFAEEFNHVEQMKGI